MRLVFRLLNVLRVFLGSKVDSIRDMASGLSSETRFYISSIMHSDIQKIGHSIRRHWGVENSLHYVLYVTFDQDKSRVRKDHAPENFAVLRHFAMNISQGAPPATKAAMA